MLSNKAPYTQIPRLLHVKDNSNLSWCLFFPPNPNSASEIFPRQYYGWLLPISQSGHKRRKPLAIPGLRLYPSWKTCIFLGNSRKQRSLQGFKKKKKRILKDKSKGLKQLISNVKNMESAFGHVTLMLYRYQWLSKTLFCLPENTWKCLETYLIVMIRNGGGVPLASIRDQGYR